MKKLITSRTHIRHSLKIIFSFSLLLIMESTLSSCEDEQSMTKDIPIKAIFYTEAADDAFSDNCAFTSEKDLWALDHQVGEGSSSYLGDFIIDLRFCFHIVYDENNVPDFENGFGEYSSEELEGYIETTNGDRLYLSTINGRVLPSQETGYLLEFHDTHNITGGTGQFEGASGELLSDSYVGDGQTDHVWEGTLILPQ